jgi:hypothetical protein
METLYELAFRFIFAGTKEAKKRPFPDGVLKFS